MISLCFIQSGTKVLYGMGQISPLFYTYIYLLPQSHYSSSTSSATRAPSLIPSCCKDLPMLTTTSGAIASEDSYQFRRQSCLGAQFHCEPLSRRHGIFFPAIIAQYFRRVEANYSTHTYQTIHHPVILCPAMVIACSNRHYTFSSLKGNSHQILLPEINLPGVKVLRGLPLL